MLRKKFNVGKRVMVSPYVQDIGTNCIAGLDNEQKEFLAGKVFEISEIHSVYDCAILKGCDYWIDLQLLIRI